MFKIGEEKFHERKFCTFPPVANICHFPPFILIGPSSFCYDLHVYKIPNLLPLLELPQAMIVSSIKKHCIKIIRVMSRIRDTFLKKVVVCDDDILEILDIDANLRMKGSDFKELLENFGKFNFYSERGWY